MTQTEKDIKQRVNQTISELMAIDNIQKMKTEVYRKLSGIDISDAMNLENQCFFHHLMGVYNIISQLEHKPVQHVKAGMRDYMENDNPVWTEMVKRISV